MNAIITGLSLVPKSKRQTFPIKDHQEFYVVWGVHSKMVRKRHLSRGAAKEEAKRLASLTGRRYYVLKAIARVDGESTLDTFGLQPTPGQRPVEQQK